MADTPLDLVQAKRKVDGEIFRLPRHIVEHSDGMELTPSQRKRDADRNAAVEAAAAGEAAEATAKDAESKVANTPITAVGNSAAAKTPKES